MGTKGSIKYEEEDKMQKLITFEVGTEGEERINKLLAEGWNVIEIHPLMPVKDASVNRVLLYLEKE